MSFDATTLYGLLPAWIRLRDAAQGGPLQDLVAVLADQVAVLEEDLAQSYDNLFIETCAPWAVPYIGDLLQTTPLIDASRVAVTGTVASLCVDLQGPSFQPQIGLRARADVAKTIYYRRRKTTLPMLEQLSADVTGWAAHVREFFQTLAWSQAVRNHIRPASFYAPDLRQRARHRPHRRAVRRHAAHRRCAPARAGAGLAQRAQCRHLPVAAAQHEA